MVDPLELELHSCELNMWILATESEAFARAVLALNYESSLQPLGENLFTLICYILTCPLRNRLPSHNTIITPSMMKIHTTGLSNVQLLIQFIQTPH